jgi:hypothetical protein
VAEFLQKYYPYILSVLNGVVILVVIAFKGKFMTRKDCVKCRSTCSEDDKKRSTLVSSLKERVTRNEDKLDDLPKSDEVTDLTLALERLSGKVDVLAERIEGVKEVQASTKELAIRLDNYLRKKG